MNMRLTAASVLAATIALVNPSHAQTNLLQLAQQGDIRNNELLVKFKTIHSANNWQQILSNYQVQSVSSLYQPNAYLQTMQNDIARWQVIRFDAGVSLSSSFDFLRKHQDIEYVAPNVKYVKNATPNDLNSQQWSLKNTTTIGADISAEQAWNLATDASDVVVAVIDTGIDLNHPELKNNLWVNPGEIAGNGIDDDGNGYVDDIHGYDFGDNDANPQDVDSHGTHVAGIIAAQGNNGSGITGIAWRAKLMAVKVFADDEETAYTSDIVNGILYAADMGAKVSNNSYGNIMEDAVVASVFRRPLEEAVEYASQADMLFIASSGNDETNLDAVRKVHSPSSIPLGNVISVAATTKNDELASYSNYGMSGADIAAPGSNIYSTVPGNQYSTKSGTSMAAPHVTGAAALLWAYAPDLSMAEVKAILLNSASKLSQLNGKVLSGGRLNLAEALAYVTEAGGECPSFTGTALNHYSGGRASYCPGSYLNLCANGTGEELGLSYVQTQYTLYEIAPDVYSLTNSCPSGSPADMPPSISGLQNNEIFVLPNGSFDAPVLSAYDREDGDISANISVSGQVNTAIAGRYEMRYHVEDLAGNTADEVIWVNVLSYDEPPTMQLLGTYTYLPFLFHYEKLALGTSWQDPGYFAWDLIDGDLTDQVSATPVNPNQLGMQLVHYQVSDSSGLPWENSDRAFRILLFLDTEKPHIEFYHPFTDALNLERDVVKTYRRDGENFTPRYDVFDLKDSEAAAFQITENHNVNFAQNGEYQVTISATDSDGYNETRSQTIVVMDDFDAPSIELLGPGTVDAEIGSPFYVDSGAKVTDELDVSASYVRDTSQLDLNSEGLQPVHYTGVDASGNESAPVTRWVNVVRSHFNHPPRMTQASSPDGEGSAMLSTEIFDIDSDLNGAFVQFNNDGTWHHMGNPTDLGNYRWRYQLEYTVAGQHTVQFKGIDANGNETKVFETSFEITGTNVPPTLENVVASVDGLEVTVTGTVVDNDNNAAGAVAITGFDMVCSGIAPFTCTGTAPRADSFTINVRGYDSNNVYSDVVQLTVVTEEEPEAECITAKNSDHISQGRAYECGGSFWSPNACATGSDDELGSASQWFGATTSLEQQGTDYWVKVSSCP